MNRTDAAPYVAFVVDDAGNGRPPGSDPHAIIREAGKPSHDHPLALNVRRGSVLVGWQCGFEPTFVAVHSYLDVELDDDEAEELAADYLDEAGWFSDGPTPADYIIR